MLLADPQQGLEVADVLPVLEIGGVDIIDQVGATVGGGQGNEAVGEYRIRGLADPVHVEDQTAGCAQPPRAVEGLLQADPPAELGLHIGDEIVAFGWNGRVEQEGPVLDRNGLALPVLQRPLQMPLADAAERSDGVVVEGDVHINLLVMLGKRCA